MIIQTNQVILSLLPFICIIILRNQVTYVRREWIAFNFEKFDQS
jgi:hypothetical protein